MKYVYRHWLALCLVIGFSWWYFFHLGFTSLQPFDEAWYANIAREVGRQANPLLLHYNGGIFTDHPPLGFWLMAISYKIFGISEWSSRIISVLAGTISLSGIYLIGDKLKNRRVGLMSLVILATSLWFILRTRSGNLDVPFTAFSIMTIYAALFIKKHPKQLWLTMLFLTATVLTKTLIGWGLLLPLMIIAYQDKWLRIISKKQLGLTLIAFFCLLLPWYVANSLTNPNFLYHHFWQIGSRGESNQIGFTALTETFSLLQSAVGGKWFKVLLISLLFSPIAFKFHKHQFTILLALIAATLAPFLFSSQTEVWHLVPSLPALILLASLSIDTFSEEFYNLANIKVKFIKKIPSLFPNLAVLAIFTIALIQLSALFKITVAPTPSISEQALIGQKSQALVGELHSKELFLPTVVFYADRQVDGLGFRPQAFQEMEAGLSNRNNIYLISESDYQQLLSQGEKIQNLESTQNYYLIRGN